MLIRSEQRVEIGVGEGGEVSVYVLYFVNQFFIFFYCLCVFFFVLVTLRVYFFLFLKLVKVEFKFIRVEEG